MLSLKLFGGVALAADDGPLTGPATQRRRLALLALIAAGPEAGTGRDRLAALLWPDTDSDQARRFLADSLYALRKALGAEAIRAAGDNLQLGTSVVACDVVDFRRALARGDHEAAAALYTGAFLDGFVVPDAAEFEQWADTMREELARQRAGALEHLARTAEAGGDFVQAASWWRQLQAADPLNSRVALECMTALEASGDPAAALRHAQVHEALLREELDVGPPDAIAALVARIRSAPAPQPRTAVHASSEPPAARSEDTLSPRATLDAATSEAATSAGDAEYVGRRANRMRRAVLALLLVVGLSVVITSLRRGERDERPRVLVTAFENRTGDTEKDVIGAMAADWIARALRDAGVLDVIAPTWSIYFVADPAAYGNATTLVAGSYYVDDDRLRLEAHILDASSGRILHALDPVRVSIDSATAGVELLRQRVSSALAARFGTLRELREITTRSQPPTYAAYSDYVQGVQQFSHFRTQEAARLFDRAWHADSSFHLAALYGVLVAYNTGNRVRGDSLVRMLSVQRDRMVPFDRALLGTFEAEMNGDVDALLRAMRTVAAMAPGSQFAIGHAVAAVAANRPAEALRTLEQLDPAVGLLHNNPRYWEWLTASRHLLGQHRRELSDARAGRTQHPRLAASLLQEIRATAALGRTGELERLLDEGTALPVEANVSPGDVMRMAAAELNAHGEPAAAARALDRAIEWYRTRELDARHRGALAHALYEGERLDEAHVLFTELAAAQPDNASHAAYLGMIAARSGRRDEAIMISEALANVHNASRRSSTLWRARIAARLGETQEALELLRQAFAGGVAHGLWLHTDRDLASLHSEPEFRRLLRPAD